MQRSHGGRVISPYPTHVDSLARTCRFWLAHIYIYMCVMLCWCYAVLCRTLTMPCDLLVSVSTSNRKPDCKECVTSTSSMHFPWLIYVERLIYVYVLWFIQCACVCICVCICARSSPIWSNAPLIWDKTLHYSVGWRMASGGEMYTQINVYAVWLISCMHVCTHALTPKASAYIHISSTCIKLEQQRQQHIAAQRSRFDVM